MPPKKKEKKKKKKSAKPEELSVEEKYRQTLLKIESLEDHLAMRTEIARRSQATSQSLRGKVQEANDEVEDQKQDKFDISSDLIRQYKSMQTEMSNKIQNLESSVSILQEKLSVTEIELNKEKEDKSRITREKDMCISELEYKIEHMEAAYENVLHDAFDMMTDRLNKSNLSWQEQIVEIQQKNKELLLEFGLKPLHI